MEHNLFLQISALLAITVSLAFIVRFLKQPLLAAYMLAGIVCGPFLFNLLQGQQDLYQAFSNFGVVLLLFIVGLELNFSYLKKIGKISTTIGLLQFLFNFAVILLIVNFFDISLIGKIFLALVSCFSSTIVVLKILSDKQDEESVYGRYTVGLLLVQDIISIGILILLSFSANSSESLSLWSLAKVIGSFLLIFLFAKYLLSRIVNHIADSGEFLFLFTVAWCFSIASLMVWSGFSIEIGAVIAGLSLSSSKYQPEIASRIKPLRDFFIVLFFVILGSSADFSNVSGIIIPAIILAIAVVILKPIILFSLFRLFKFTRRNSFLSALTAAPLSEFGFIILFAVISAGYLSGPELSIFTISAILTIFISSYLMTYSYHLYNWLLPFFKLFGLDKYVQQEDSKEKFDAVVFGYHRTGWKIGNALRKVGLKFAAVDFNPGNVHRLTHQDIKVFFGDASDIEFLKELPLEKTKIIISTIPSPEDQLVLLDFLKSKKNKPIVICTLYNKRYLDKLYEAGADYVILPHLLGGMWVSELIMNGMLKRKRSWSVLRKLQVQDLAGSIESGLTSHLPS